MDFPTLGDLARAVFDSALAQCQEPEDGQASPPDPRVIPTGYRALDRLLLGGLLPGSLLAISGKTGVGKSAYLQNMALQVAGAGVPTLYASLETTTELVAIRMLSAMSMVTNESLRSGKMNEREHMAVLDAIHQANQLPMVVRAPDYPTADGLVNLIEAAREEVTDGGRYFVAIDGLNAVEDGQAAARPRYEAIAEVVRAVKRHMMETGGAAALTCQLRYLPSRNPHAPLVGDITGSSEIAELADALVLLDRSMTEEEGSREDRPDYGVMRVMLAKSRLGGLGADNLAYFAEKTRLFQVDEYAG